MKIKVDLNGFSLTHTDSNLNLKDRVRVPNQSFIEHIGAPNIPMIRKMIAVPEGSDINVTVKNGVYEEYCHRLSHHF